jgi:RNA polymerase sigma-70 factor (ECF subfamily)
VPAQPVIGLSAPAKPCMPRAASAPTPAPAQAGQVLALTRRLKAGDEQAWQEFHELYVDRLWRYLLVVNRGNEEAASESLQLTFVRAARHMRRFESEPLLWSWLTVLARSAAVDERRKRNRYLAFLDRFLSWQRVVSPGSKADADERLSELLRWGLAALPRHERWLLEQKYLLGVSVRKLAADLDKTEKAVESRLGRTRRKLKDAILARLRHET